MLSWCSLLMWCSSPLRGTTLSHSWQNVATASFISLLYLRSFFLVIFWSCETDLWLPFEAIISWYFCRGKSFNKQMRIAIRLKTRKGDRLKGHRPFQPCPDTSSHVYGLEGLRSSGHMLRFSFFPCILEVRFLPICSWGHYSLRMYILEVKLQTWRPRHSRPWA